MSNTPRTDEAQFMPSEQHPAFNFAQYMVKAGFAQTLERENAALRGQLQKETQRRFDGNEIASKEHREEVAALREQLAASRQEVEVQKAKADKHYELGTEYFDLMVKAEREIATLRDALSRLVEVHDEMGGVCGTVRIAAEEALLGKAQSEYICTCGIRVTPHKCPTDNDF
jgi:hypothetical protein